MSDTFGGGAPDQGTESIIPQEPTGSEQQSGDNPAWNEVLEVLPSEFHHLVKPHFAKWDQGVQKRFEQVHSQYDPYKPFVENKVSPDELNAALQMMQLMANEPRRVYDKLTEYYGDEWGLNSGQGQPTDVNDDGFGDYEDAIEQPQGFDENNPYFQQIKRQQDVIAEYLAKEIESKELAKINQEIDQQFSAVSQKYGDLSQEDVNIIVSIATTQNVSVTEAADALFNRLGQVQQRPNPSAGLPPIVPTGGGVPNAPIDPAALSNKDTKHLVESILRKAYQSNNQ